MAGAQEQVFFATRVFRSRLVKRKAEQGGDGSSRWVFVIAAVEGVHHPGLHWTDLEELVVSTWNRTQANKFLLLSAQLHVSHVELV